MIINYYTHFLLFDKLYQQKRLQALLNAHRQQVRVMEQSQQANHNSNKADGKDQNEQQ